MFYLTTYSTHGRMAHTTAFVTPVVEHWLECTPSGNQVIISIKRSNLIISLCSFDLSCPMLEIFFYRKCIPYILLSY